MTQRIGLLGYPLSHSISPAFQQAALDYHSLPASYSAWPTPAGRLSDEVSKLRYDEYLGANVTIPHKERVRSLLDVVDDWAEEVGAVNTIVKSGRQLIGYNTDAYGFMRSLREKAGFEPKGKSVLLLGAGGAARSAAFGLAKDGIISLTIANRTLGRARKLAEEIQGSVADVATILMNDASMADAAIGADLIVNATSIGMSHGPGQGSSPLRRDLITPTALVYDMVYAPTQTPLLLEANKMGAQILGGLWMLVYQGAASFELWTGNEAPIGVMFDAAEKALAAA